MSLTASEIEPLITTSRFSKRISILLEVDSTQDELRRRESDLPNGQVLIAEHQSHGRGRRGRHWVSPIGQGLHLSLLWRSASPIVPTRWTFAAAVAACDAVRAVGAEDAEIKWPNDLLIAGKKVGGILVEMRSGASGAQTVLLGLGVNIHTPAGRFESVELSEAGSLRSCTPSGIVGGRARVAGEFLVRLDSWIDRLAQPDGWQELRRAWLKRSPTATGSRLRLFRDGEARGRGCSEGIDDEGALRVLQEDGVRRVLRQVDSVRFGE